MTEKNTTNEVEQSVATDRSTPDRDWETIWG